jgi:hypothetical protein
MAETLAAPTSARVARPSDRRQPEVFALTHTERTEIRSGKNLLWFSEGSPTRGGVRFLVLTTGNCGALWFASALNLHEGIFAGCGVDHPIDSCFEYDLKKDGDALLGASGPRQFRFGARPGGALRRILEQRGLKVDVGPRNYERLAWYVFDELEDLPNSEQYAALGSVHALSATDFAKCYERDTAVLGGRRVIVANMIRHPVPRTESYIKAFISGGERRHKQDIDRYINAHLDHCRKLEKAFAISMDDPRVRAVLFTYRIGRAVAWVAEELLTFRLMTALKMEDLQSDPEYFAKTVSLLTDGRIRPDAGYLERVYRAENLGAGRRSSPDGARPIDAAGQWEAWSDWEREEFRACCRHHPILPAYAEHGYRFSFMK